MLTPEARRARARTAGLSCHARGKTNTAPATAAAEARFEREVLAEANAAGETLTSEQIERRAKAKRALFFARLSFASAKARIRSRSPRESRRVAHQTMEPARLRLRTAPVRRSQRCNSHERLGVYESAYPPRPSRTRDQPHRMLARHMSVREPRLPNVNITITGKTVALCHRRIHDGFGVRVDAWKYPA